MARSKPYDGWKSKARIPLADAKVLALEVVALLVPVNSRIEIGGSIRRGRPMIGDIEIVTQPICKADAIGGMFGETNEHFALVSQLRRDGVLQDRLCKLGRPCFGERFQRVIYKGFALDLFCVLPPAQWGVIFALRTGPEGYNRRYVADRNHGGWLPEDMALRDGQLFKDGVVVPTPEEAGFFKAIGLKYVEPCNRDDVV